MSTVLDLNDLPVPEQVEILHDEYLSLAKNPNTPADVLDNIGEWVCDCYTSGYDWEDYQTDQLCEDIGEAVAYNHNTSPEVLRRLSQYFDRGVLSNPNTPQDILLRFLDSTSEFHQYNIVCNPNCPAVLLSDFSDSNDTEVRCLIAAHPNTPTEILQELAEDPDIEVSEAAEVNLQNRNL
jgi:hypothetical protein